MSMLSDDIISIDESKSIYTADGLKHVYTGYYYSVKCLYGGTNTARVYDVFFQSAHGIEDKMAPFKSVRVGNRPFMQSDASVPANIMFELQNK